MSLENVIVIDHPVVQTKLTELRDFTGRSSKLFARCSMRSRR
jgi:hypothetical protein